MHFWLFQGIFWVVLPSLTIQKLYVYHPIITWGFVLIFIVALPIYLRIAMARIKPLLMDRRVDLGNRMAILIAPTIFVGIVGGVIGFTLEHFIASTLA